MEFYKYIILGAGAAGLSCANALYDAGERSFIVVEKERQAGGLCRSENVDGFPLDIGGGHFLDTRRPKVNQFLFRFMPESEWSLFCRDSRIEIDGSVIGYPFEANIWQLPQELQIAYLKSVAYAGCNIGASKPEMFTDWIRWKLGDLICERYMIPYNTKLYGKELDCLGTYWMEKLPDVSFDEIMLSCLNKRPYGQLPGHAKFYYPKKYGYGELWLRMADAISSHIKYNASVETIDFDRTLVKLSDGSSYQAECIITTVPWTSVTEYIGMPSSLEESIKTLKYTSINITYIPEDLETSAHWIYYPDLSLPYHRILVRSNFCQGSKGYWTETNSERYQDQGNISYYNEYAYPLNTTAKPNTMNRLLKWSRERSVIGLGRFGEWQHYNSDVVVERALQLVEELMNE